MPKTGISPRGTRWPFDTIRFGKRTRSGLSISCQAEVDRNRAFFGGRFRNRVISIRLRRLILAVCAFRLKSTWCYFVTVPCLSVPLWKRHIHDGCSFREEENARKKKERNKKIRRYIMIGAGGAVGGVLVGECVCQKQISHPMRISCFDTQATSGGG